MTYLGFYLLDITSTPSVLRVAMVTSSLHNLPIIELAQLHRLANKKVMLITGLRIPEITDRSETLLFDWEDFEVAGSLDKLSEAIQTRQRFERERDNLTAESSRKEVEAVLGCSPRQASRVLQRLRGQKIVRAPLREQILSLLADGEKKHLNSPQLLKDTQKQ